MLSNFLILYFSSSDNEPGESLINKFLKKKSDRGGEDEVTLLKKFPHFRANFDAKLALKLKAARVFSSSII
jgi:hypothetical protein